MSTESTERIEEEAAAWLLRREGAAWSANDEVQLQNWLDASAANAVAFVRLEVTWERTRKLKALGPGLPPGVVPPPGQWQVSPFFEQIAQGEGPPLDLAGKPAAKNGMKWLPRSATVTQRAGVAATLLLAVGLGAYFIVGIFQGDRYATPLGGLSAVPMSDGSRMTLNTASEVRVAMSGTERHIELEKGEAFFEVAKDPSRPFVVYAGSKRVVAVGTQFSVRLEGDGVEVAVTEGEVRIESAKSLRSENTRITARVESLTPGKVARSTVDGFLVQQKDMSQLQEQLAWRAGYLVFDETPLADAVAEFNRYNAEKIEIGDPQVGTYRVSGKFRPTSFEAFVRLLETAFPIEVRHEGAQIKLSTHH